MEYWTDLYKELSGRVKEMMPGIEWIDLWHEQVNYLTEELPFPVPAVFFAFNTVSTVDRSLLVQDCDTQVDVYLYHETFADSYAGSVNREGAVEFLDNLTRLHAIFHGKPGVNYSGMRRVDLRREDSGGAGNLYRVSFQCLVTDYSARNLYDEVEITGAEVIITPLGNSPGLVEDEMYDLT